MQTMFRFQLSKTVVVSGVTQKTSTCPAKPIRKKKKKQSLEEMLDEVPLNKSSADEPMDRLESMMANFRSTMQKSTEPARPSSAQPNIAEEMRAADEL